jgi:hypothetical protein
VADVGPLPGLSEILAWSTEHLTEGADYLDVAADRAEAAVVGMRQDVRTIDWWGEAADAERARAGSDKDKVCPVAADLRAGAGIARQGASNVLAAQNSLRYAVQDAHCTTGPLGIASCQDTGESLTMRIVVDPTVGRPDVRDGGQKGVITMFPLSGGSGVIDLGPNWTWTPPWVNNYVPIN